MIYDLNKMKERQEIQINVFVSASESHNKNILFVQEPKHPFFVCVFFFFVLSVQELNLLNRYFLFAGMDSPLVLYMLLYFLFILDFFFF